MPRFLSDEWIEMMDTAARDPQGPRVADGSLVIQHVVTDVPPEVADPGTSERTYHLHITTSGAHVGQGRHPDATVTFTATYDVAAAVAGGARSAQAAFMSGHLRIGGAVDELMRQHGTLADAGDPFGTVRSATEH